MENKSYQLRYLPMFETDVSSKVLQYFFGENTRKNLFDFWKNRKYNSHKRVASKRKSSLPAARFLFVKT